jgi:hypothetical protein
MKHSLPIYYYNSTYLKLSIFFLLCFQLEIKGQTFTDVSAIFNINSSGINQTYGNGLSVHDINQDGWDDLVFAPVNDSLQIFLNDEGMLIPIPSPFFVDGDVKQILWVDYDNDGNLDLFFTLHGGTIKLYKNDGNFNFTDVSISSGLSLASEEVLYYGASFADFDNDGDLDLYVCTYTFMVSQPALLNKLFKNNGDGTFTDVTLASGTFVPASTSFLSIWFDADANGLVDLFVINDKQPPNYLFLNEDGHSFTERAESFGLSLTGQNCMSGTLGDYNNDGLLDLFITNTSDFPPTPCFLMEGNGDSFIDKGEELGVSVNGNAWGGLWIDYDNDSWLDLYVCNATFGSVEELTPNVFYKNLNATLFEQRPDVFPMHVPNYSFAVAKGDFNNDGFSDLAVTNAEAFTNQLLLNSGNSNNWIKITPHGILSNQQAIGTYIYVYADSISMLQYTMCGENYLGQNSQHIIFGLGTLSRVDSVKVIYPSGIIDRYFDLDINQHYHFFEGESLRPVISSNGSFEICFGQSVLLHAGNFDDYTWSNGSNESFIEVSESGLYYVAVTLPQGLVLQSDTIQIVVHPKPEPEVVITHPTCFGNNDGSINLINNTQIDWVTITWNGVPGGNHLQHLSDGIYSFLIIDQHNCEAAESINILEPPPLSISLIQSAHQSPDSINLQLTIFGGTPPYSLYINEAPYEIVENIALQNNKDFLIEIIDANGCSLIDTLFNLNSSFNFIAEALLKAYPIPFDSYICFDAAAKLSAYTLIDSRAKVVRQSQFLESKCIYNLNDLASGLYIFILSDTANRLFKLKAFKQ